MSPRARQFSAVQITAAAVELVREQGWSAVSARTIAQRLGTSTTPIYSVLGSMAEIEEAVRIQAMERLLHAMLTPRTGNALLDLAVGYVKFSGDERLLFRFLYIDRPSPVSRAERERLEGRGLSARIRQIFGDSDVDPLSTYLGGQSVDAGDELAYRAWIFTHGLAMLHCAGVLPDVDEAEITRLLNGAGMAFFLLQQQQTQSTADGGRPGAKESS